jgi:outer membrane protein assembly factor BamB
VVVENLLIIALGFEVGGTYKLSAYNVDDGKLSWSVTPNGEPSPPVAMSGYFAVVETVGYEGADLVIRTLGGNEVSRTSLGFSGQWGKPAVANGRLLAAGLWSFGRCMVECYDINNLGGGPLWRWDARLTDDIPPPAGFVMVDDRCAFLGPLGRLVLLNMPDGKNLLPDGIFDYEYITPPASNGTLLFGTTADGRITAIQISDATLKWSFDLPQRMAPLKGKALAYRDGRLFCPCKGGVLVVIK